MLHDRHKDNDPHLMSAINKDKDKDNTNTNNTKTNNTKTKTITNTKTNIKTMIPTLCAPYIRKKAVRT